MDTAVAALRCKIHKDFIPSQIESASHLVESRFDVRFGCVAEFFHEQLKCLQDFPGDPFFDCVKIKLANSKLALLLKTIANHKTKSLAQKRTYLESLLSIYELMRGDFGDPNSDVLVIAPKREGMLLAKSMGWLSSGDVFTPELKRIALSSGIAVGIEWTNLPVRKYVTCKIIDGALASGSTVMTIMDLLCDSVSSFEIYSVHGTEQSVRAIRNYARLLDRRVELTLGFVSGKLNTKYYAIDEHESLVVGDLGDTISELFV